MNYTLPTTKLLEALERPLACSQAQARRHLGQGARDVLAVLAIATVGLPLVLIFAFSTAWLLTTAFELLDRLVGPGLGWPTLWLIGGAAGLVWAAYEYRKVLAANFHFFEVLKTLKNLNVKAVWTLNRVHALEKSWNTGWGHWEEKTYFLWLEEPPVGPIPNPGLIPREGTYQATQLGILLVTGTRVDALDDGEPYEFAYAYWVRGGYPDDAETQGISDRAFLIHHSADKLESQHLAFGIRGGIAGICERLLKQAETVPVREVIVDPVAAGLTRVPNAHGQLDWPRSNAASWWTPRRS